MKTAGLDAGPREFDDLSEPLGRINQVGQKAATYRSFTDTPAMRAAVLDGVKDAYTKRLVENKQYQLRFADVNYDKPKDFTLKEEKEALLKRRRLYHNLHGRLQLVDKATGQVVSEDEKPRKLAEVPWLSRRGTWIHNGTEYLSFNQMRLKPGAYTRLQTNGDVETQFNVLKGSGFRVKMTPDTGVFRMKVGQSELKLYPVLKALGVSDKDLHGVWGQDLLNANKAADDKAEGTTVMKVIERLGGHNDQGLSVADATKRLPEILAKMEMDPGVTRRTLGKPYANVDHNVILAATKKILGVHKGEVDADERDDLPYQSFHGPEDFFREHVEKDAGQYLRQALFKASWAKDTKKVPDGYFSKQLQSVLMGSGLAASLTEINPLEIYDMRHKITRMGEGGIGSTDVVPKNARGVQPTHFGFLDPIRAPECYDAETEVMTELGWKPWPLVTEKDHLACLIEGRLEFSAPEKLYARDYSGLMYGAHTDTVEYLVTPNHRMYSRCKDPLRDGRPCGYKLSLAPEIQGMARCVLSSGFGPKTYPEPAHEFFLPAVTRKGPGNLKNRLDGIPMVLWAEFLGWYLAEGSLCKQPTATGGHCWTTCISQTFHANPDNVVRIAELLTEIGFTWSYTGDDRFNIPGKQLASYLAQFGKSDDKHIPAYIFEASVEARLRFAEAAMLGDGRRSKQGDRRTFTSSSREFAYGFERLMFGLGKSCTISYYPDTRKDTYLGCYEVYMHTRAEREISHRMPRRGNAYFTKQYSGKVYCATVPGGLLYVRRGGKCGFWCGNSQLVALDLRVAHGAKVGSDGRLYQDMTNVRTGKLEPVTTEDISEKVVAFPGELKKGGRKVSAMVAGQMRYVPREKVDYELPHASSMWSPVTNMVPFMSGSKGQRVSMGSRMQTQALALREPEAPLVRTRNPLTGGAVHRDIGKDMGAVFADKGGVVVHVDQDSMVVLNDDGTRSTEELYNNFPLNQKGFLHNTPVAKVGQRVNPGDALARSNYTNDKGESAIGRNVTMAFHAMDGLTHEDAIVVSESAAKKFASEQMYEFSKEKNDDIHDISKSAYVSKYGGTFDKAQLDKLDDNGVVKVGTILKKDDPIILAVGKRLMPVKGSITKGSKTDFSDSAETWEHDEPAEVVDVRKTQKGFVVSLKSYTPLKEADKLCYSEDTEVLTWEGWKPVAQVTLGDKLASLGPCGQLEYIAPVAVNSYEHAGRMYSLETTQVSLLVTENHNLYACPRNGPGRGEYGLHRADALFGKTYKLKNNIDILLPGVDPGAKRLPDYVAPAGQGGAGVKEWQGGEISAKCFAFLLGAFLSEGCVLWQPDSGNYGICISQTKPEGVRRLLAAFAEHGLRYTKTGDSFVVYGKALALLFSQFAPPGLGRQCHLKRIPQEVWGWTPELQFDLFDWLVWGDGSIGKTTVYYTTVSPGLSGDIQRLALHLGFAANVRYTPPKRTMVNGTLCDCRARYDAVFYLHKNHPEIHHGHHGSQKGQKEAWVQYSGRVYCPSLPVNHVLYVRRKGKAVWCGNSGLFGNKGIISKIVPDHEMLKTADGKTIDIVMNPTGIVSRVNPAQLAEAALGKIAQKFGKTYEVDGFPDHSIGQFAMDELQKHGMNDTETVTDPKTGRQIKDVFVGVPYIMKLHHMAEGKMGARDTGGYTQDELPAKGGPEGAKRIGLMEVTGLISHGATDFLEDMKMTRGQRNEDYWRLYRLGLSPPAPRISKMYDKFEHTLKAAGVHLRREGSKTMVMPATQKEVEELGGDREITVADTVDFDSQDPVKGGLFDIGLTGGKDGKHWSHIKLAEKMPNPIVEEPIRSLLGLTKEKFRDVLSGKEDINGVKGPLGIEKALELYNIPREIAATTEAIKSGKKSIRDKMVKKLGYLKSFERMGVAPRDFMLSKVPVLPPKFRPITQFQGMTLAADANYLYKDLMEANHNVKATKETFGDDAESRLQLYDAFKAVTGLGGPITPENQERKVKGLLKQITGDSPKFGMFQRKVVGNPVDLTGRAVLAPGHDMDIDEVGLPADMMWKIFKPFVIRRMARAGMPAMQAMREYKARSMNATKAMLAEAKVRPVVINRAPSLHKLNLTGHYAHPIPGHALKVSHLILAGHAGDYDGDTLNVHVPVSDKAVADVQDKMMPSKMLLSPGQFDVHLLPPHVFTTGLYAGSQKGSKKARTFNTKADAIKAYRSGDLDADDPVIILAEK